jgi:hypothetical protein
VVADPGRAREAYAYAPPIIPFESIHLVLIGLLVVLTLVFVHNARALVNR